MAEREFSMDSHLGRDLMQLARVAERSSASISRDLAAALFPGSELRFSDRMLAHIRLSLNHVIADIETKICINAADEHGEVYSSLTQIGNTEDASTFSLLREAGLLNDPQLLDYFFARGQENELWCQLLRTQTVEQLETGISQYLDSDNRAVADAAMGLLTARARSGAGNKQNLTGADDLPAEVLHGLVWKVTAALEKLAGLPDATLENAAENHLAGHDESRGRQNCAERLAAAIEGDKQLSGDFPDPVSDGLDLFVARLAYKADLLPDQIVQMSAEPQMARLVILFRALDCSADQASTMIAVLSGGDQVLTGASYREIDADTARQSVRSWSKKPAYREAHRKLFETDGHQI